MRLLYVCENYWPMVGGAEHASQMICQGMAARGHKVTVVTHRPAGAALRETVNGVAVVRVPCNENRYAFTVAAFPAILKHAASADIVHTSTFNAAPPSWIGARLRGRRVLVTVWETWVGRWNTHTTFPKSKATLHEMLERAVLAFPYDRYVAISKATQERLCEVLPDKRSRVGCVYLGFDPAPWGVPVDRSAIRAELNLADSFLVVGYGRPGVSKGFRYLVDAARGIRRAIPSATVLLILSDDPQYQDDLALLKGEAPPNVRFLPPQPSARLVQIVKSADCVVVPSITEGFGYTTLEACASGVPVVASRTTSIPEVIGGAYVLSEPRNSQSIADAVTAVRWGHYETKPLKSFPWSSTIDGYEAEYGRLCAGR
jgi:glycosyltransferase involved in cell wall biosynthesis